MEGLRIIENRASGETVRIIALTRQPGGGIAYASDVIAVSLRLSHEVHLLDYVSATVMRIIGSGVAGRTRLSSPGRVRLTPTAAGQLHLLVADTGNNRSALFDVATGVAVVKDVADDSFLGSDSMAFDDLASFEESGGRLLGLRTSPCGISCLHPDACAKGTDVSGLLKAFAGVMVVISWGWHSELREAWVASCIFAVQ